MMYSSSELEQVILQPQANSNGGIESNRRGHSKKRFDFCERLAHFENTGKPDCTDQQEQQCICLGLFTGQSE